MALQRRYQSEVTIAPDRAVQKTEQAHHCAGQTNATGNRLSPRAPLSKAWYAGAQSPRRSARGAPQSKAGEMCGAL